MRASSYSSPILSLFLTLVALFNSTGGDKATAQEVMREPIPIRDARPYNLLFLQFVPETGDVLPARTNRYDLQLDLINNLLIPATNMGAQATVVEDNEYQRLRFAWRCGVGKGTEVGVFVPLLWRNGGVMDGIIKTYHHLTGLVDNSNDVPNGRDYYGMYHSRLELIEANGRAVVNQGNAFGLGETIFTLKRSLLASTPRSALAVRAGLKLPTGNPHLILGSGSTDFGVSFDGRYALGREIVAFGNLGYVVMGPSIRVPGGRPNTLQTLVGLAYLPNHRDSFVLQIDGNGQFVRTGNAFADGSNVTATFGYRRLFDRHHVGFVAFSEGGHIHNYTLPSFSNVSPSFTVSTGFTWTE